MLSELENVKNHVLDDYNHYDFASAMQEVLNFLVQDVSALYGSIAKDSLYCDGENDHRRKEYQTVIYEIVNTLTILLAPVLAFTMDEVYQNIPYHKHSHVLLEDMVKESHTYASEILDEYRKFTTFRNEVMKKLEEARNNQVIGSALESEITLKVEDKSLLNKFSLDELKEIFIVSKVNVEDGNEIIVKRHPGEKCERCWSYHNHLVDVNGSKVCSRCEKVLKDGKFF